MQTTIRLAYFDGLIIADVNASITIAFGRWGTKLASTRRIRCFCVLKSDRINELMKTRSD